MTDREKFQKTFSKLHASPDLLTEVVEMAEEKQVIRKREDIIFRGQLWQRLHVWLFWVLGRQFMP